VPDEASVRILVHRQNIHRYKFLLETKLTDVERAFITSRIAEEEAEIRRLGADRRELAGGPKAHAPMEEAAKADDRLTSS
jgi:hypothetical protein